MRKVDPAGVCDDFIEALDEIAQAYVDLGSPSAISDKNRTLLAEQVILSATVLWEGFVADLLVAYVNRDSTQFVQELEKRIRQSVEGKYGTEAADHVSVAFPEHLKKDVVERLVDHRDYNLTFTSAKKMAEWAQQHLATAHAQKFIGLSDGDSAAIDAWRSIRNFLAHRSKSAKKTMNDALNTVNLPAALARGQYAIHAAGAFLKATPIGGNQPRLLCYLNEMKAVAGKLC